MYLSHQSLRPYQPRVWLPVSRIENLMPSTGPNISTDNFQTPFFRHTHLHRRSEEPALACRTTRFLSRFPALHRVGPESSSRVKEHVIYPTLQTICSGYDHDGREISVSSQVSRREKPPSSQSCVSGRPQAWQPGDRRGIACTIQGSLHKRQGHFLGNRRILHIIRAVKHVALGLGPASCVFGSTETALLDGASLESRDASEPKDVERSQLASQSGCYRRLVYAISGELGRSPPDERAAAGPPEARLSRDQQQKWHCIGCKPSPESLKRSMTVIRPIAAPSR
jgi:hypothetical protein